jgi:hypothetical protein
VRDGRPDGGDLGLGPCRGDGQHLLRYSGQGSRESGEFFRGLSGRTDEVKRRCRTILQTKAETFTSAVHAILPTQPCRSHLGFGLGALQSQDYPAALWAIGLRVAHATRASLELQARGELRATDLATRFEVSLRTSYRDLEGLAEGGVP